MSWEPEEKLHRLQGSQGSSLLPSASPGGEAALRAGACCHRPVSRDTPPSSSCKEAPVLGLEITGRSRWRIQSSLWVSDLYTVSSPFCWSRIAMSGGIKVGAT